MDLVAPADADGIGRFEVPSSQLNNWQFASASWSVSGLTSKSSPFIFIPCHVLIHFDSGTNNIGGTTLPDQTNAAWLVPICLQLGPALVLLMGMMFMPFSPRWLIHHDREADARRILANLRGLPDDHELVELEFLEIKAQSIFEKRTTAEKFPHLREPTALNTFKLQFVAMKSLFQSKAMFKRVL
jgi:Sugar (and other) transporter